jgi:hypothetical protein
MRRLALSILLIVPALAGCPHEVWVTPVAVLPARAATCPVAVAVIPEPGTKVLALVRCSDGLTGKTCSQLVREKACEVGGDVAFGAHYEGGELVVTVGATPAGPQAAVLERQNSVNLPAVQPVAPAPVVPQVAPAAPAAPPATPAPAAPPPAAH